MKRFETTGLVAVLAALALSACSSGPQTPDEFRVVRKAPLTVPPDYNLRPPAPGESRPQELEADAQARVAVFGTDIGKDASEGEKLLVKQAGGDAVDRAVRAAVDYDAAQTVRKSRSFSDSILNFGRGIPSEPLLDPVAEAERLRAEQVAVQDLTGGGDVLIRRRATSKLPGL
ncbi:MAG: DUF3035 domain-containing protein [Alphaproteobacteria bacterium]|nr:DUF3035 domain-containing protein [Alphaproteobacteria bacterium]